ncbi:MAG TPA: FkbM family methyltransferase [Crenalkalicoccus sp.]|jgi:FkbM family methyltransferase|nr:FkbM family methyltransferase [Crenalkalicoccus sp.]
MWTRLREGRLARPLLAVSTAAKLALEQLPVLRRETDESLSLLHQLLDMRRRDQPELAELRKDLRAARERTEALARELAQISEQLSAARQATEQRLTTVADGLGQRLSAMEDAMGQRLGALGEHVAALRQEAAAPAGPPAERSYFGLDELDRKLEAHMGYDGGFFVELGANDGVAQSNTLYFERYRGWRGVLVEPTPHNFLRCLANRSPETKVFCCACTAFDYPDRFVEIAYSNLMSTPIGLESDIADPQAHAEEGRQFLPVSDRPFSFGAVARPLNDVLLEAGAPPVMDLLSLDVEGAEIDVLKGLDHGRFRFRYICIECRSLPKVGAYLAAQGYELVERVSHHDYLFRAAQDPA